MRQAGRNLLRGNDRARQRILHRRQAVITGLLSLTVTAMGAAGIAVHNAADTTQPHAIAQTRYLEAESLASHPTDLVTAQQPAVAFWRMFRTDQSRSVMTTLPTGQQERGFLLASLSDVNGVAFSPDGKLLAAAGANGTVQLWDLATGQPAAGFPMQTGSAVNAVAFSPDGKLLAAAGANGTVHLWDLATGQPVAGFPMQTGSAVNAVAFSPDGKLLAAAGANGTIHLWGLATGGGIDSGDWFIIVASVIAIVLSALAVAVTAREIWPASRRPR